MKKGVIAGQSVLTSQQAKMKPKFVTGDIVRLASGGPNMTIRGVHFDVLTNEYRDDMFDCIWFEKNIAGKNEPHFCPFYASELIKVGEFGNELYS